MTADASLERFWSSASRPPEVEPDPVRTGRLPAFLVSADAWLTLAIVFVVVASVTYSLRSADWVSEMPSLFAAAMAGLLSGWLLAHVPWPSLPLYAAGGASGLAVAVAETMHTMRLEDPLLHDSVRGRWSELWARLADWGRTALEGGISTDPLPFVLLLVFLVWLVSAMAAWAAFRWRNAWLALIPGGFVLLTNISYLPGQPSEALVVFLFAAILLVTHLHYVRALRAWRAERTWRAPYLSFEVLSYATWVGLLLLTLAWIIPTANDWGPLASAWRERLEPLTGRAESFGRLFVGVGAKRDQHLHMFGDVLPLQGKVTLSDEVLLHVDAPGEGYLRGAVYNEYSAQGWRLTDASVRPLAGTGVEAAGFGTPTTRAQLREAVTVQVTVEQSVAARRLFSAGDPIAADIDASVLTGAAAVDVLALVPEQRVREGTTYSTVGTVSAAGVEQLMASGRDYPQWVRDRYLQLPGELPPAVATLAAAVGAGRAAAEIERILDAGASAGGQAAAPPGVQPYVIASRVERFLRGQYPFDLTVADPPPRQDAVAYFLFDARRGYFDHHASAMAVMLRTLGVPARVATGFVLVDADLDRETKQYLVTGRRAWAWPEVYFEGLGWVRFNPTPAQSLVRRPDEPFDPFGSFGGLGAGIDGNFDEAFFEEFLAEIDVAGAAGLLDGDGPQARTPSTVGTVVARTMTVALALLAAAGAGALTARGAWAYWFRGLPPAAGRWARLQLLALWGGASLRTNRTPLESAREIEALAGGDAEIVPLAHAFTRERYGSRPAASDAGAGTAMEEAEWERLGALYAAARNRLLWKAVRRRLWPLAGGERTSGGA